MGDREEVSSFAVKSAVGVGRRRRRLGGYGNSTGVSAPGYQRTRASQRGGRQELAMVQLRGEGGHRIDYRHINWGAQARSLRPATATGSRCFQPSPCGVPMTGCAQRTPG